jgi:hypothetical protein
VELLADRGADDHGMTVEGVVDRQDHRRTGGDEGDAAHG